MKKTIRSLKDCVTCIHECDCEDLRIPAISTASGGSFVCNRFESRPENDTDRWNRIQFALFSASNSNGNVVISNITKDDLTWFAEKAITNEHNCDMIREIMKNR